MQVAMLMEQVLQDVPGGTGRYSVELARALRETAGTVDTVTSWIARHGGGPSGVPDARQLALPQQALSRLWALPARLPAAVQGTVEAALARTGPTGAGLIFAPTPFAPPRGRTPLVVAIHDAVPWTAPETMSKRGLSWHRQIIAARAADADAILTPTQAVAEALLEHVPTLTRRKLHVTGEGTSNAVTELPADAAARAEKLQLPQRFLLMVGTLEPRKGLDVALRALADERTGDLPLIVIGQQGWGDVDVLTEAATYGLAAGRVRLLGTVADADLATAYSRATAVVVPSRDEGFGLPAVEALAHGTPVLVSSAPALVEVTAGVGIVTPVGDRVALAGAIADVVGWDAARRAGYAGRARAQAATHTWANAAHATWAVFRAVSGDSCA